MALPTEKPTEKPVTQPVVPVVWQPIAHTTVNLDTRNISNAIVSRGWKKFWEDKVKPTVDKLRDAAGVTPTIMYHNPFGALRSDQMSHLENAMDMTQYHKARQHPALRNLCDSFVDEMGEIREGYDGDFIMYIGSVHRSMDLMHELIANRTDDFLRKYWYNLRPYLETNMSLYIDNQSAVPADSLSGNSYFQLKELIETYGGTIGVEASPRYDGYYWSKEEKKKVGGKRNAWFDERITIRRDLFQRRHRVGRPSDVVGMFPEVGDQDWYTKDVMQLMIRSQYTDAEHFEKNVRSVIEQGCTPAPVSVLWNWLLDANVDMRKLLTPVDSDELVKPTRPSPTTPVTIKPTGK